MGILAVIAAVLAVFIGMAVGLLGGGGSILTTPLLVYVAGFDPKEAITASLFVVAITSIFGLIGHARAGRVIWKTGVLFGVAGMVGAFIGGQIGSRLPGIVLLVAFAIMMGVTAVAMIRGRKQVAGKSHGGRPIVRILIDGLVVGLVTGLVGAGGGFLVVPALVLLGGLAMPNAVATSLLVVAMKSIAGFFGYALSFGGGSVVQWNPEIQLDWPVILIVTGAAIIGALIGSRLVGLIHPDLLRKIFGWFVLVMAVFILVQEIGEWVLEFALSSPLQAIEVVVALAVIIALFTWVIRRPAQVAVADFDEPIPDESSNQPKT
jgi:uncharacterized membrane protein YfcA